MDSQCSLQSPPTRVKGRFGLANPASTSLQNFRRKIRPGSTAGNMHQQAWREILRHQGQQHRRCSLGQRPPSETGRTSPSPHRFKTLQQDLTAPPQIMPAAAAWLAVRSNAAGRDPVLPPEVPWPWRYIFPPARRRRWCRRTGHPGRAASWLPELRGVEPELSTMVPITTV